MEEDNFDIYTNHDISGHGKNLPYMGDPSGAWMHNAVLNFFRIFFVAIVFYYICKR
jgi:hypothetical protein